MASFNDLYKKYVVFGECYYNLETHELKLNHGGETLEEYTEIYPHPRNEEQFMNVIYLYITKCEDILYRDGEKTWVKLQDNDFSIKLMIVNDSN